VTFRGLTKSMKTILVVEDDLRIQKALQRQFTSEGYAVRVVSDGAEAVGVCKELVPVAVVLDLMLPGVSGREICKQIKTVNADMPVIILSAISEVADKVLLLELGADDYVTKPFSPRELLARVQAAIRRATRTEEARAAAPHAGATSVSGDALCRFGEVSADLQKMEVKRAGNEVTLTAHEFKLLRYFLTHVERVITREELLQDVWGYNFFPTTRIVDNQVLKLRQKLEVDPAHPVHFRTVHGIGYKFVVQP
jgi:DNA-binding response OmpR family regulator